MGRQMQQLGKLFQRDRIALDLGCAKKEDPEADATPYRLFFKPALYDVRFA